MNRTRIDIGVGGRFHSDEMAKALLQAGHDVHLFTSLPADRFPQVRPAELTSYLPAEIAYRGLKTLRFEQSGERAKMLLFGRFLAKKCRGDVVIVWSSFAKEVFSASPSRLKILVRDSTHIVHQMDVMSKSYESQGLTYKPDTLCIDRELQEYELADHILVLSHFAKETFVKRGIPAHKVHVLALGVNTAVFRADAKKAFRLPLKALYFGTLSLRKGIHILLEATKEFSPEVLSVTLVGPVDQAFRPILKRYSHVQVEGPMSHKMLGPFAAEHDLYLFPSLEDGFPNTLIQAMAAGLIPISTKECGPAEWIADGKNGLLIPSGSPEALKQALERLIANPQALPLLREGALRLGSHPWTMYASEVNRWLEQLIAGRPLETSLPYPENMHGPSRDVETHDSPSGLSV